MYYLFLIKRIIEDLFIFPFVVLGRLFVSDRPLKTEFDIYFIFPFYHTGGAEKVNSLLANAFRDKKCVVIFTRKSHDEGFKEAFQHSGHTILDISYYSDNKKTYWKNLIWRGVISAHINRQKKKPVVINGQCNFAYKISPWINKNIPQIELIHSFNSFSAIRIPFLPFYRHTVMISRKAINDHTHQYQRLQIPESYLHRITFISNGIFVPHQLIQRDYIPGLVKVLYAGRATPEKRVDLAARIAVASKLNNLAVQFTFVGDIKSLLPAELQEAGIFSGMETSTEAMTRHYSENDAVIITSSEEGFPMSVMEGMAYGSIIMSTPVGDIPARVKQGENGYLFSSVTDQSLIIEEALRFLEVLLNDLPYRQKIAQANHEVALKTFSIEQFEKCWRTLVNKSIAES